MRIGHPAIEFFDRKIPKNSCNFFGAQNSRPMDIKYYLSVHRDYNVSLGKMECVVIRADLG